MKATLIIRDTDEITVDVNIEITIGELREIKDALLKGRKHYGGAVDRLQLAINGVLLTVDERFHPSPAKDGAGDD